MFVIKADEFVSIGRYVKLPVGDNVFRTSKKLTSAEQADVFLETRYFITSSRALKKLKNARRVAAREEQRKHWRK